MGAVLARELLGLTVDEIWRRYDLPKFKLDVQFDNGVVQTTGRELILSQYFWNFHRVYPDTPLLVEHLMDPTERLNKKTSLTLIGSCFWSVWDNYAGNVSLDALQRLSYEVTNLVYNEIVLRLPGYITSISAKDITDVLYHPVLLDALTKSVPTQNSIQKIGKVVQDLLTKEGELIGNRPAESAKSGLVSAGQQNQIFGDRGFVTDIDSNVFRNPVMTGYGRGMHKLHDYAVESRSASKALFFAKDPLAEVEYLNRQLQLLAQSLKHLFKGDCGSEVMLPLTITTSSDLKTYEGKYYYATSEQVKTPTLFRITKEDKHLVGQTVMVRTPLGCKCLPHQGVCQACLGEISLQIPDGANLGHLSVIELCSGVSQNVLSTKHLDSSSSVEQFHIAEGDRAFLNNGSKDSLIRLAPGLKSRKPVLTVSQAAAFNLTELHHVKDLTILPITRISEIDFVNITCDELGTDERVSLDLAVSVGTRRASFTPGFLAFIKKKGWVATEDRGYVIDLSGWDFTKDVFELPLKNINTMEFMAEVAAIIKFNRLKRRREKRAKELARSVDELAALVVELHDTVNRRFTFNIAHCELILSLCLVRSAKDNDYRFPGPEDDREFAPFKELMNNRSMGVAYAFEKHGQTLLSIDSFLNGNRCSHPMDRIYVPEA
jgi:hypothetical protein